MDLEELTKVFEWCRAHPHATFDEAKQFFYKDAEALYEGCRWVRLQYQCAHASPWVERLLLTDEEYELLSGQELHLGDIDGKHSDVSCEWEELEVEVIEDAFEIASKMKQGETISVHESRACGCLLTDLEDALEKCMSGKYMRKLLDKFYPPIPDRKKPDTTFADGEFKSSRFLKLITKACDAMHDRRLYHETQQRWQRKFVELVDVEFGGTSDVLSVEQPWFEL